MLMRKKKTFEIKKQNTGNIENTIPVKKNET